MSAEGRGRGRREPASPVPATWGLWHLHFQGGLVLCAIGAHRKVKQRGLAAICARCRWEDHG